MFYNLDSSAKKKINKINTFELYYFLCVQTNSKNNNQHIHIQLTEIFSLQFSTTNYDYSTFPVVVRFYYLFADPKTIWSLKLIQFIL